MDASGNIFIADTGDNRVRRVDAKSGIITAAVFNGQYNISGDGGPALDASMALPLSVAVDSADNIFISGGYDFTFGLGAGIELVQKVDAATQIVSAAAGQYKNPLNFGFTGDGGLATNATLNNVGIAVDSAGNLYIADTGNDRVRKVGP